MFAKSDAMLAPFEKASTILSITCLTIPFFMTRLNLHLYARMCEKRAICLRCANGFIVFLMRCTFCKT